MQWTALCSEISVALCLAVGSRREPTRMPLIWDACRNASFLGKDGTDVGAPCRQATPVEKPSCSRGKGRSWPLPHNRLGSCPGVAPHCTCDATLAKPRMGKTSSGRRALCHHRGSHPYLGRIQSPILAASLRSRSRFHSQGLRVKFVLSH